MLILKKMLHLTQVYALLLVHIGHQFMMVLHYIGIVLNVVILWRMQMCLLVWLLIKFVNINAQ